jgi:subtilisin family serine protease
MEQANMSLIKRIFVGFLLAGLLASPMRTWASGDRTGRVFEEGKAVFFKTIEQQTLAHPERNELAPGELKKIAALKKTHPRLYGILINYYYQKEAPALGALLKDGTPASQAEFRTRYLELARSCARMFVDCLFWPSSNGPYFRRIIPRFKGKDRVDIVLMSTGIFANFNLPSEVPEEKKDLQLSPEFDKQWGLDAAGFRAAHRLTDGRGVKIAVIDSGIDVLHPVFGKTLWGNHFNFVGRTGHPWDPAGPPMVDWGWHGTVVTSIVAKYAPGARITMYREIDAETQNDSPYPLIVTSIMGAAIYKAVHDGNDVINISAGTNIDVGYLREACRYAYDHNVIVVAASPYYLGRFLGENRNYPGQYPTTIAVTGIEKRGENQYGYWDIASPEVTTTVGAPNAPFVAYPTYVPEKDEYAPGISCATPIVTSLAALAESVYPRLGTEAPGEYYEAIKSLLTDNANSKIVGFEGFSPECGHGLIDAERTVRAALERQKARAAKLNPTKKTADPAKSLAFEISGFPAAQKTTRGNGVKLAVIDSTDSSSPEAIQNVVSACAPDAEIRLYRIPLPFEPQDGQAASGVLAQAIEKAAQYGPGIILVNFVLGQDFPVLERACQSAYEKNILVIAPNGPSAGGNPERPGSFPAHYTSVVAVSGAFWDFQNRLIPWNISAPSERTLLTAPAGLDPNAAPGFQVAAAMTAGLAALISSQVPKPAEELNGQYVQRIREIMVKSSDPGKLGLEAFDPRIGYGLIDARKALEETTPAYLKKAKEVEDDMKKRLERRAQAEEERTKKKGR